ncbi:MAG: transcription-repair coupling factor [Spirochaetaceae bacterium]|jgi:transcription-repair coupling factor (superfamily II helicase)|nr:transcription-repair coupling factor [Spirochaetaceae bacterium]
MNTLPFLQILHVIRSAPPVSALLDRIQRQKDESMEIEGPEGAAQAIVLSLLIDCFTSSPGSPGSLKSASGRLEGPFLAVVPTEREAEDLARDINSILEGTGDAGAGKPFFEQALVFPWWGTLPYRDTPPLSPVFGERTKVLGALLDAAQGPHPAAAGLDPAAAGPGTGGPPLLVIVPERAFLSPLPPPSYVRSLFIPLAVGSSVDTTALADALINRGYTRVPRVQIHGEFALRGEVLDIWMGGDDEAYRILLDFDRVESIKRFDPLDPNQTTVREKLRSVVLRPLKELIWTSDTMGALEKNLAELKEFSSRPRETGVLLEELQRQGTVPGEELFFPLVHDPATLLEYCGPGSVIFYFDRERLVNAQEALEQEYQGLFRRALREKPVPPPDRILLQFNRLAAAAPFRSISFMAICTGEDRIRIPCDPPRSFFGNLDYLREEFSSCIKQGWTVAVAVESEIQAERIAQLLGDKAMESKDGAPPGLVIFSLSLSAGFSLPSAKLMVVQENEIFGRRRRPPRSLHRVKSSPIDTFVELNPGDFVVHINHGIGLFKGIERIRVLGSERDYVKIQYQDDEAIFVPIEQVNLVQRYIGNEGSPPRLDKLGSKSWENRKGRVKKSVENIAQQLLAIYSKRRATPGYVFPRDSEWQTLFEAAFPFEETEDQLRCVEEIKADMEAAHPMDRLVCGDVGYGKTEVAIRACFKAIMGGKQAAFLAPTTILAEQHYENFQERFRQFPVKLAMLSRFVSSGETRHTLNSLACGEVDLLVGTHRIIQADVIFKDLGLLVIDEEQRFGVKDKERLKELKANVDCLTLSATPIPRTLHMSLLKIRDMSLLTTAPLNRHPIETLIGEFNEDRIARAIRSEVGRGGQVFFLHNRVETLKETMLMLQRIVPEMLIEAAHGRMEGRALEDVMRRFIHGGFHVLVSTTIIENGIDIPNVNTIIIDRADMYGVSQLYQLWGRVGRSDRVAYAFLFYPRDKALTELAMKRLQVISDFTELGSGFKIAMKDMEIRGAGNLLGREQSGDIYSVGFDLYMRLLDEAVQKLENEKYEAEVETFLELEYSGFIPDTWIDGPQEKMEVYKKIAAVKTREELENLHGELADRFGPPPDEVASLLSLAEIRIICRDIAVTSLREKSGLVRVEFAKLAKLNIDRLLRLIKENSGRVKLDHRQPNVLLLKTGSIGLKEKSEFIREKLAALAG